MCCLTATASPSVQKIVVSSLGLLSYTLVKESPERTNIRYSVISTDDADNHFKWLQSELQKSGPNVPKIIIFCKLKKNCSLLHASLTANNASLEQYVAIFHADSPPTRKAQILTDYVKKDSNIRVLLATSAFGMGVHVEDLHTVLHYGPSRDVDDYFQESGRVGRDGHQSYAVVINYKGKGKGVIKPDMRKYVDNKQTCRREQLLQHYGETPSEDTLVPHNCCDNCSFKCECGEDGICALSGGAGWVERCLVKHKVSHAKVKYARDVTTEERDLIRELLLVFQKSLVNNECDDELYAGTSITSGFPTQLIELVCGEIHNIGGIEDLSTRFPFFNLGHVKKVWNIIDEVCQNKVELVATDNVDEDSEHLDNSTDDEFSLSDLDSDDAELRQQIIDFNYKLRVVLAVSSDDGSSDEN